MARDRRLVEDSAWLQAGRLGFRALYLLTCLAALGWLVSNIREVGPESQAVVFRFGAVERVQTPGLLIAWPSPIEKIVLLPSPDRILQMPVQSLTRSGAAEPKPAAKVEVDASEEDYAGSSDVVEKGTASSADTLAGSGYLLTGDSGAVQLDVTLSYRVTDPYDYVIEQEHVVAALDRLARRNAVTICAARDIDSILVARPELIAAGTDAAARREQLRGELVEGINQGLAALKAGGAGLGVEIVRVDIQSKMPDAAVDAFNAVLTASQQAERAIAAAQNDAAQDQQTATQDVNRMLQDAQATADERIATARSDTATIASLARTEGGMDPGMPMRLYRDRMSSILSHGATITVVNPADSSKLILQGSGNGN